MYVANWIKTPDIPAFHQKHLMPGRIISWRAERTRVLFLDNFGKTLDCDINDFCNYLGEPVRIP